MAIVANTGNVFEPTDKSFKTYSATNAGSPNGSVTPAFAGQRLLDTTNQALWEAKGTANTSWVLITDQYTAP